MNRYISKSYTTNKNAIDQQYTERGQLHVVSTITSYYFIIYTHFTSNDINW